MEVECFNMALRRDEDTQIKIKRLSGNTSVYARSYDLIFHSTRFRERKEWFVKRIQLDYKNCSLTL